MSFSTHDALGHDLPPPPQPSGDDTPAIMTEIHPGTRLGHELRARGLSANAFALKLRVPANRVSEIIRGRRAISPETALRISRCLGGDPVLWLTLQAQHDLAVLEHGMGERISREIEPV